MPRLTVLQLDRNVPLDRFAGWLDAAGAQVSVVDVPAQGVPGVGELTDGLLVLGGRMNAFSVRRHPWLPDLRALFVDAIEEDVPALGICLGHQVLADALGGEVVVNHPGGGETGPVRIDWAAAAAADPLLAPVVGTGQVQPESHHDAVTRLPAGATELAASAAYPHQAFRFGSAVGVQFHPEASPELVGRWMELNGKDPEPVTAALRAVDAGVVAVGRALAESFVRVCDRSDRPAQSG